MNTPALSKKQQKRALSGKKAPVKGLRNVLAQPCEFIWPIIRDDDLGELRILLQESMPAIKRPSLGIPWSHLHKLNKTERRAAREEARSKLSSSYPDKSILNSIVTGVNGVTRLLEKNDAACVLLEANLEPMLLVKHIVTMAESNNVSVILVPFLKSVTLETAGFASAAVALKKTVAQSEDHHFNDLYKKVVELAENFHRSRSLKLDCEQPVKNSSIIEEILPINTAKSCEKEKEQSDRLFTISTDVYMYRNSREERVFVPESTRPEDDRGRMDVDFISIGSNVDLAIGDSNFVKGILKTRYVDMRGKEKQKSSKIKADNPQAIEYISLDPSEKFSASTDEEKCNIDSDVLYEKKTKILGMSEKDCLALKASKFSGENYRNKKIKYESLKVKRIQGNFNRVKATKIPKRNNK